MKTFIITMKDGAQFTYRQHGGWEWHIANCMSDPDFGDRTLIADDGSWVIAISEIAYIQAQAEQVAA